MDRSLAFFHDAFAMEVPRLPESGQRAYNRENPQLFARGAARLQLRVQDIDAMVSRMKSGGMTVVSQGGGAVPIPPNFKGALVADFDNFFLTPFEPVTAR